MSKRGATKRAREPKPHAHESDGELFERAMADVVRLAPDARRRVRARPPAELPPRVVHRSDALGHADEGAPEDFAAPGVDRRELRKLKRGEHTPGARRDLHGMTAAEASASVIQFLDASRSRFRCVSIVHGRGLHSAGQVSVLRVRVRACLRAHPAVLAFTDAPRNDGGAGAVYVLLRK